VNHLSKWQRDTLERIVRTFVQAFLAQAALTVTGVVDLTSAKAVAVSAVAAGMSAVMSMLARGYGDDPASASFEV
jgi:hypothetical protein